MPFIQHQGAKLFYEEAGAGEVIFFSHGLLFDHRMWAHQVKHFSKNFRCIAHDHRAQGKSTATGTADMELLYTDVLALLDQLAPRQRVHFVGLSMGGFIGMRVAARQPHRLKTLTLLETSADEEPNKFKYNLLNTVFKLGGGKLVSQKIISILFGKSSLQDPALQPLIAEWKKTIEGYPPTISQAVKGVIDRQGVLDELKNITVPTLVGVGDEDIATKPEKAESIHGQIKNSQFHLIPKAGHSSCLEQPEIVNQLIENFLKHTPL